MKKIFLILLSVTFMLNANAQNENPKQKEIGVSFSNLDNFGLTYRFGRSNALWSITGFTGKFSNKEDNNFQDTISINDASSSLSLGLAREYRKPINEKIQLRYGLGLHSHYSNYSNNSTSPSSYYTTIKNERRSLMYGGKLILGANYTINDHFLFGIQFGPSYYQTKTTTEEFLTLSSGETENSTIETLNNQFSFSNNVLFSLVTVF